MSNHRLNLELKVRCEVADLEKIEDALSQRPDVSFERLLQVDTYFRVGEGRLKIRTIRPFPDDRVTRVELIAYRRPSEPTSRWSNYEVVPVDPSDAAVLERALGLTHDLLSRVEKVRTVAIVDHTRVHLDRVERLGAFIELETVVSGQSSTDGEREHAAIIAELGLERFEAISGSYSDLLANASESTAIERVSFPDCDSACQ